MALYSYIITLVTMTIMEKILIYKTRCIITDNKAFKPTT